MGFGNPDPSRIGTFVSCAYRNRAAGRIFPEKGHFATGLRQPGAKAKMFYRSGCFSWTG